MRAIVLVKGVNFYGFHASYSPFLKIYALNPTYIARMVSILQSGSVMGYRFRVFESHISYILQFLCDFNLYGCGTINIEDGLERCPESEGETDNAFTEAKSVKFAPSSYFRESRVPLEIDIIPSHILNKRRLHPRNTHHQLHTSTPDLPSDPLVLSVRELWDDERRHRQTLGLNPSPEMPIDSSDSSPDTAVQWTSEVRWWEGIRERIERERMVPVTDHNTEEDVWEQYALTTFESVEALWEAECRTGNADMANKPRPEYLWDVQTQLSTNEEDIQIEVDTSMFSDQEMNRLDKEEKEHWDGEAQHYHADDEENDDVDEQQDNIHEEDAQPGSPTVVPGDSDIE